MIPCTIRTMVDADMHDTVQNLKNGRCRVDAELKLAYDGAGLIRVSSLWAGQCRGMTWSVATSSYQYSRMSPSDNHHSRLTGRDAFIDQCPIMETEKGSLAAIEHEVSGMFIVLHQKPRHRWKRNKFCTVADTATVIMCHPSVRAARFWYCSTTAPPLQACTGIGTENGSHD